MACLQCLISCIKCNTVKGERFAGPNFHGFRGFEGDQVSFSVNILYECLFNNYQYNISAPGQRTAKVFPNTYFIGSKPRKFSLTKLPPFTVPRST